ncbi:GrlR family regulatory protein [Rhizobium redzepovicii]|uniref:GrlR family regulatory protein n=1 Tax=Rhizobium redzepovicii TaxID=2867518 RepID=A0AAW8P1V0_9HYPH|nr:GrlR family regulatory protein [Rhizobium redzepovicii]MDR9760561.1 GrlR family regulatory protein [Rhizobium redzepovicii]
MRNGLYKVTFGTPLGSGYGVVYAQDGKIRGGDSLIYYTGTYSVNGADMSAEVDTDAHSNVPGMTSVLGPAKAKLLLQGRVNGDIVACQGTSPQAQNVTFKATLQRIAD